MIFYRIVLTDPPTVEDFLSYQVQGRTPATTDPEAFRLWSGISVYATEAQARRQALAYPFLGPYLARLEIPDTGPIRFERTTRSRGHYTLWGEPGALLACVVVTIAAARVR